jgi:hypothetical protein
MSHDMSTRRHHWQQEMAPLSFDSPGESRQRQHTTLHTLAVQAVLAPPSPCPTAAVRVLLQAASARRSTRRERAADIILEISVSTIAGRPQGESIAIALGPVQLLCSVPPPFARAPTTTVEREEEHTQCKGAPAGASWEHMPLPGAVAAAAAHVFSGRPRRALLAAAAAAGCTDGRRPSTDDDDWQLWVAHVRPSVLPLLSSFVCTLP